MILVIPYLCAYSWSTMVIVRVAVERVSQQVIPLSVFLVCFGIVRVA